MTVLLNLIVMTGMLVVVPLGLRLVDGAPPWLTGAWVAGAVPGAVSLWLPRGAPATVLAGLYAVATLVLAGYGVARVARTVTIAATLTTRGGPAELALVTAALAPAVAGLALVAERYGYPLFGFPLRVLSLTVAHFQFAGFAAALVAALVAASTRDSASARVAAVCVPAGTLVVLAGFFTADAVELAGAAVLTAGLWLVGWVTWREIRPGSDDRTTRALLAVAALVPVATMALALDWAAGRAFDLPHASLNWMIATHGAANALGFGVCSVLAWRRLKGVHSG